MAERFVEAQSANAQEIYAPTERGTEFVAIRMPATGGRGPSPVVARFGSLKAP